MCPKFSPRPFHHATLHPQHTTNPLRTNQYIPLAPPPSRFFGSATFSQFFCNPSIRPNALSRCIRRILGTVYTQYRSPNATAACGAVSAFAGQQRSEKGGLTAWSVKLGYRHHKVANARRST